MLDMREREVQSFETLLERELYVLGGDEVERMGHEVPSDGTTEC